MWMSVFGSSNPNEVLSSIPGPLRLTSSPFLSVLMPMRSPFTHCLVPSLLSGSPVLWRRPGGTSTHALPLCMWWAPRVHCTRILPLNYIYYFLNRSLSRFKESMIFFFFFKFLFDIWLCYLKNVYCNLSFCFSYWCVAFLCCSILVF